MDSHFVGRLNDQADLSLCKMDRYFVGLLNAQADLSWKDGQAFCWLVECPGWFNVI